MGDVRKTPLLRSRIALLLGLLALLSGILAFAFPDLVLAYRLSAAQKAIESREFATAIDTLERSRRRGQHNASWHYLLARAYRRDGNLTEAESHLRVAALLGWPPADIDRQRVFMAAQDGRIKEVEAKIGALIATAGDDQVAEELYEAMGRGYLRSFQVPDAIKCLSFWSSWQPDNAVPHLWLADLYERIDDPTKAESKYRKVLNLDPDHQEARSKLAQILIEKLELDEAAELFQQSLEDHPDSLPDLLGLADVRRRQGQTDIARSLLHETLTFDLKPEEAASALATLGQMAVEDRQYHAAVHMLEQSVKLHPNFPDSRQSLAAALTALGQEDRGKAHREAAKEIRQQHTKLVAAIRNVTREPNNPEYRCQAGLILIDRGLGAAGANWLKTALAVDPNHRASHLGLARFYEQTGDTKRATEHRLQAESSDAKRARPAELPAEKGEDQQLE